jgi:hypothetical protein
VTARKVIHKYQLQFNDTVSVQMPRGAKVLSAKEQYGSIYVWAEVDPDEPVFTTRTFRMHGTGHGHDAENNVFIDTVMMREGAFVLHIFELVA